MIFYDVQKPLLYFLFLTSIVLQACDTPMGKMHDILLTLESANIEKKLSISRQSYTLYAYHAGINNTIIRDEIQEGQTSLKIYKRNVAPVLVCVHFNFENYNNYPKKHVLGEGSAFCPFARGAVYPYHAPKVFQLSLRSNMNAELARAILLLHSHGASIDFLNVYKFIYTLEKKESPFFLETQRFLHDIARSALSVYSIKARETVELNFNTFLSDKTMNNTKSRWISASGVDFVRTNNTIILPSGRWLFFNDTHFAYVNVSSGTWFIETQEMKSQ